VGTSSGLPAIRPLSTPEDMHACEDLQQEVWGFPDREIVPLVELVSVAKSGGCIAGAFHEGALAGFVYGLWGLREGRWYHYSRMLAVRAPWRGRGLGRALKLHQRGFCLERGIDLMRWTFDPLEGPNAALNVGKLGVVVDEYIVNYYGLKQDALNRGLPTDRLFVKWHLDGERVRERIAGRAAQVGAGEILSRAPAALSARPGPASLPAPEPREVPDRAAEVHVEIPGDVQDLKRRDLALASAWRLAVRETCVRLFQRGFRVEEFGSEIVQGARRSAYLLRKGPEERRRTP
jgi:chorismate synthase